MRSDKWLLKELGRRIRYLRLQKGLTLEDVQKKYGYPSWRHLQRVESGKNFTMKTFFSICRLYQIPPYAIVFWIDNDKKRSSREDLKNLFNIARISDL